MTDGGEFVGLLSIKDFANYYHNAFNADDSERGDIDYFMQKRWRSSPRNSRCELSRKR